MTAEREGLAEEIARVLAEHYPVPVFGCECTPVDDETGIKDVLDVPWEQHAADALADLLAARDRRVQGEAWDEGHEVCCEDYEPVCHEFHPNPYTDRPSAKEQP